MEIFRNKLINYKLQKPARDQTPPMPNCKK